MTTAAATLPLSPPAVSAAAGPAASADSGGGDFFSGLLEIINPLQHIPVVSTLYRAITGDQINDVERVAGDTLYGGLIGLGSSLLNIGFRELTGKDVGDTVLAFAENVTGLQLGSDPSAPAPAPTGFAAVSPSLSAGALASVTATLPAPVAMDTAPAPTVAMRPPGVQALFAALTAKGIDPALAARAMSAYGKSIALTQP